MDRRAGLVQAVESYRRKPEGPGFKSRSPRIAQARVRLATDTLPQTPHRVGALCIGYALFFSSRVDVAVSFHFAHICMISGPRPSDLFGRYTWKIENFSKEKKREMKSEPFEAGGYKW